MKVRIGLAITLLLFFVITPQSFAETKLWDLQIQANVENPVLNVGDIPVISGRVTDQASNPLSNVQVRVLVGTESQFSSTNKDGSFKVAMVEFSGVPGVHIVNVMATSSDGRMGIESTNFQVKGDITPSSVTQKRLSTAEAVRYLNSTREDHTNNPIGLRLYDYYQSLYQRLQEEKQLEKNLSDYAKEMSKKRENSDQSLQYAIELKKPDAGVVKSYQFNEMVGKVDKNMQGIIASQLNYTTNNFAEARMVMNQILDNGGSPEEAKRAYYEKLAIPRDTMERMTSLQPVITENATELESVTIDSIVVENSTVIEAPSVSYYTINGTNVSIGLDENIIILDINGTMVRFMINGTQLIPITNSTNQ